MNIKDLIFKEVDNYLENDVDILIRLVLKDKTTISYYASEYVNQFCDFYSDEAEKVEYYIDVIKIYI